MRFVICCLLYLLSSSSIFTQIKAEEEYYQNLALKPEVSELFKFQDFEEVNSMGQFQFDIDLFNIGMKRLDIPVKLSYTSRSISPNQLAPNYGMNWYLSGQGAIKRTVKGLWDFTFILNQPSNSKATDPFDGYPEGELCDKVGWLKHNEYDSTNPIDIDEMDYERKYLINNIDNEPDVFECKAPGLRVKFIFDKDRNPHIIEGDNVFFSEVNIGTIEVDPVTLFIGSEALVFGGDIEDVISFKIVSQDGFEYTFTNKDLVWEYTGGGLSGIASHKVGAWKLDEIKDVLTNEMIIYQYLTVLDNQMISLSKSYSKYARISSSQFEIITNTGSSNSSNQYTTNNEWQQLQSITFPGGILEYQYSDTEREDRKNDFALKSLALRNMYNQPIKVIELETSYYEDLSGESSALRLDAINIKPMDQDLASYSFDYIDYSTVKIPKIEDVYSTDIFGYIKQGLTTSNVFPTFYYTHNESSSKNLSPYELDSYANKIEGVELIANEKELKIGVLKTITLPQKGVIDLDYEVNDCGGESCNGIRISQIDYKDLSTKVKSRTFLYGPSSSSFPQFVSGNRVNRLPVNLGKCNQVYYDYIDELVNYPVNSASKTRYYFYSPTNYYSSCSYDKYIEELASDDGSAVKTMTRYFDGHYASMNSGLSPISGHLKKVVYYNSNDIVKDIEYNYSFSSFDDPLLDAEANVTISSQQLDDHAYGAGVYVASYPVYRRSILNWQVLTRELDKSSSSYVIHKTKFDYSASSYLPTRKVSQKEMPWLVLDYNGKYDVERFFYTSDIMKFCSNTVIQTNDDAEVQALKYMYNHGIELLLNRQTSTVELELKDESSRSPFVEVKEENIDNTYLKYERNLIRGSYVIVPSVSFEQKTATSLISQGRYMDQGEDFFGYYSKGVSYSNTTNKVNHLVDFDPKIKYDRFSEMGKLLQYHKNNDVFTSVVWGYNDQYPIAKIENITYSELESIIDIETLKNLSNADDDHGVKDGGTNEDMLRTALDVLRDQFSDALVSTYTYDPLIGMTSETDANGITTYYEYDDFGRLKLVRDNDGNILQRYDYNYAH